MSNAPSVSVQHAIVHIADRNSPAPVCSDFELDLAANPNLQQYFEAQVQNALGDDQIGAAIFAQTDAQDAKDACNSILASQASFIAESQKLAKLLHTAMRSHPKIAPGSLAVCVYTTRTDERALALMKLDPNSGLRQRVEKQDGGKLLVSFDVLDNVMPTAREKLQKAALVAAPKEKQKYDLLLLDRQTPQVAAAWWAETFLNTAPVYDGRSGADGLHDGVVSAHKKLWNEGAITSAESEAIQQHTRVALQKKSVNRKKFVEELPVAEPAKEVIEREIEKRLPGLKTIPIDRAHVTEKVTKKTHYQGDFGIVIEFDSEHEKEVVYAKTEYERDDGVLVTRITLDVPRLQWVK